MIDSWDSVRAEKARHRREEEQDRHKSPEQEAIRELRRLLREAQDEIDRLKAADYHHQ